MDNKHPCNMCVKTFLSPNHLAKHKMTHTGEKPHKCEQCNKSFSLTENLKRHLLTHKGPRDKPHECGQCKKAFSQQRWTNNSVFEWIRIWIHIRFLFGFIFEPNIFVFTFIFFIFEPNPYFLCFSNIFLFIFGFHFLNWIYSYLYTVFEPNIFVFDFHFLTKYIFIRIQFLFLSQIESDLYIVFLD